MRERIMKTFMDPSYPLSKRLPFKSFKKDNGCFSGTVRTGKLFWDTQYVPEISMMWSDIKNKGSLIAFRQQTF